MSMRNENLREARKLHQHWCRERERLGALESVESLANGYRVEPWIMARMLEEAEIIAFGFARRYFPEPAYAGKGPRSISESQFA